MRISLVVVATAILFFTAVQGANAAEIQTLSAQVEGTPFVSDDDDILFVPVKNTVSLSAQTAGASSYPPPKTRVDRLSIMCKNVGAGTTVKLDSATVGNKCEVSFEKGHKSMGGSADAEYALDKYNAENFFEITAADGKLIEGKFDFRLKDKSGTLLTIKDGRFKAEDRQL